MDEYQKPAWNHSTIAESHHTSAIYRAFGVVQERLSKEDAEATIFAHQILFPRSSARGVDTLLRTTRALTQEEIPFRDLHQHEKSTQAHMTQRFLEEGNAYALLLAASVEYFVRENPQGKKNLDFSI